MKGIIIAVLTVLFPVAVLIGCTPTVRPMVSESEFLIYEDKEPGHIDLFIAEEFRSHTETKTDVMDFKKWKFELGPVAVDTFKYALASKFESVDVKLGSPKFPLQEHTDTDLFIAVEPAFAGFKSHVPYAFKFETYSTVISFRVKTYDKNGNLLLDKVYEGVGKKRGSIGSESAGHEANAIAAQLAVKDAVNKAVAEIIEKVKAKKITTAF